MAEYREKVSIGEAAKDTAMIGGGFIVAGFAGRYVEEKAKPGVTAASSTTDKVIAGAANNAPKLALYYLLSKVKMTGAAAAMVGSVGYDVLIRLTNQGINPANINVNIGGKAYRIMNNQPPQFAQMPVTPTVLERERRYGAMPFEQSPVIVDRQRRFGSMIPEGPGVLDNPRRYGAMPFEQHIDKTERERKYGFARSLGPSHVGVAYNMK